MKNKEEKELQNQNDPEQEDEAELDPSSKNENNENSYEAASVDDLQTALEAALLEATENKDSWMRAQAEFSNFKKRKERDGARLYEDATGRVIKRYLDILDDLSRALDNRPSDAEGSEWAEGIELIYRKFITILGNEGVKLMEAEGQEFDPNFHEALSQEESPDHESGQIIEVIQQGYLIGERVLRPALVRIAS